MSYCVNCGVELEKGTKRCPLCMTPVINPNEDSGQGRAYPEKVVLPKRARQRYAALLLSIVLAIPNIICPVVDYFFTSPPLYSWSAFVNIASAMAWVFFVLPFLLKRTELFSVLLLDTVVTCVGVYLISLKVPENDWFFKAALPFILFFAACVAVFLLWSRRKKREWPSLSIAVLIIISVLSVVLELLITNYVSEMRVAFSLVVALSCAVLIIFFAFALKNKRLRAWLSRKFFI